jgi:hypothetical protein
MRSYSFSSAIFRSPASFVFCCERRTKYQKEEWRADEDGKRQANIRTCVRAGKRGVDFHPDEEEWIAVVEDGKSVYA